MLLNNDVATAEIVVLEGILASGVEMVGEKICPTPSTALFAVAVRFATSVVIVVVVIALIVDRDVARVIGTKSVANVVATLVVDDNRSVDSNVLVVDCSVDTTELMVVIVVVLIGASVAINGKCGHGYLICGPSILSNT